MKKLFLFVALWLGIAPGSFAVTISAPSSVQSGTPYSVSATQSATNIYNISITIVRNGSLTVATNGGGGAGTVTVTANYSTTDTGSQNVSYTATANVQSQSGTQTYSASTSVNIWVPNNAPTVAWVQNPPSAQVNQVFAIQAVGHDNDGNLTNIFVWRDGTPFAFDGPGNGYDSYSDANQYVQSTPGTVTFAAQAQDSFGATSPTIYHTVTITNNAPTISASAANIYVGQAATVNWSAADSDGNLNFVNAYVTRWGAPIWDDLGTGGATGSKSWSSSPNFSSTNAASSSYLFVARAWDTAGAFTDTYAPFDVINRQPNNATIAATVNGNNIVNNGYIWLGDQISIVGTLHDDDGNLVRHGLYAQRTTQAIPDPGMWSLLTNNVPSNGANSTVSTLYTPNTLGRWDVHTDGDDGYVSAVNGGNSLTIYVYGTTNDAVFQSQSVPTSATTGDSFSASITMANGGTSNRPWITDSSPHKLVPANGVNWGVTSVALPGATTVFPPPQTPSTATFTFTATAPTTPGTYQFQWQMSEQFPGNPALFGQKSTVVNISVVDNDAPSVPGGFSVTNKSHNSFTLNWAAATDNSGAIALYEVSKNGTVLGTTSATSYNVAGLTPNTAYTMKVRAKDAAGNWSALNSGYPVTTALDPNADADGDGMTNGWEQTYFGSPTAGDPNADPDNDGFTNIAEFNLGKNPIVYDAGTSTQGNTATPGGWPNSGINPTVAVGATAGQLTVDKSGALTYSIPIWTTPGTAGMEPKMALNYSSQAGNGVAGMGWSLSGTSSITRGGRTKAIDGVNQGVTFTANDRFYLDGQRLILVAGLYGAANSEYRTEIDSFSKVIAYGNRGTGPAYFKAWTKAGLIIEFGNTGDSAYDGWGHPEAFSWSANKISDTKGNYMSYSYEKEAVNGIQRLTRIDYTGNAAAPYASLRFEYEARNDTFLGYPSGATVSNLKRLKTIKSCYGETVAHTYTLNFTERAAAAARSLLTSITETGSDGRSYPNLVFSYETPTGGWAASGFFSPPTYPYLLPPQLFAQQNVVTGAGMMDLNGDGYPDFVRKKMSNAGELYNDAYLNTASGFVSSTAMRLPGSGATLAWENKQDAGCRLVDVNGDGLVDSLFSLSTVAYATHNNGTGWDSNLISPTPAGFAFAQDTTTADSGRRVVDINGDGLPDIVWNTSSSDKGCYINNFNGQYQTGGPAWVSAPQWAPPFAIMANVSSGSQFFDVNGDGLPDLVQMGFYSSGIEAGIALNSPTGWGTQNVTWNRVTTAKNATYATVQSTLGATLGKYLPPVMLSEDGAGWQVNPTGTEVIDLNGDGLPDVIFSNPKLNTGLNLAFRTAGAWFNTGNGWVAATSYTPPVALVGRSDGNELDSTGALFTDLNGDGLPDLAMYRSDQSSVYYLNNGHGWGAQNTPYQSGLNFALPVPVVNASVSVPTGFQLVDLNADGIMDLVANNNFRYNLAKPTADKLIKVTNGLGVAASVSYATLTERDMSGNGTVYTKGTGSTFPAADVTGPMLVVKTVSNDDGVGGQYPVSYKYAGLRTDALRGSLGFASMVVTDGRTGIQSQTTFAQTYPYIGMPLETKTVSGSTVLSDTLVSYGNVALNSGKTKFVYAADSFTTTKDLDGTVTGTVDTTVAATDIDPYGNILKITVNTDGYTKTTTSVYTNDLTNWFLGRLSSATVVSAAPSLPSVTRTSSFTYDTAGLLKTEAVETGNAQLSLTTTYGYDTFGNKNSVMVAGANITVDAAGTTTAGAVVSRTTTTSYDASGRFPVSTTNALGHSESYNTYDQALGVLKQMTGANGLVTTWDYDGMGRKIAEHRADGTHSYTNYRWVTAAPAQARYYGTGTTPAAKYHVESVSTGSVPSLAFYDAFGRSFLGLSINGDGKIVYQTKQFDAQGRAFISSTPYFASTAPYWASTTSYDLLNRPLTTVTPDEEASGQQVTSTSTYSGLQGTATDPKGRVSRTIKNSQGWTIQNTRNETALAGATASTVTYGYDAIGNLTSTTAAGVTTTLVYDLRGRKTSMVDADMGTWNYRYNIFGELIWQKDAKGQITTMAYDALGRLSTRGETEGTSTWTYDTAAKAGGAWKGKLASVSSPGGYLETYDYDAIGRPATVWRTIPGATNTTAESRFFVTQTYDSVGRPEKTIYPSGFQTINVYNGFGYLKEVRRADSSRNDVYWMADSYAVTGKVNGEYYGNGLANDRTYSDATGRLRTAAVGRGIETTAPFSIQYLQYNYDAVGNVTNRSDSPVNRTEVVQYDGLDRLKSDALTGAAAATVTVAYDASGNITNKSDVGNYVYSYTPSGRSAALPHAVSTAGSASYTYDANGNMLGGNGRTVTWTSFNQVKRVQNTGNTIFSDFTFGAGHERIKEVAHTGTTVFIGSLFERVTGLGGSPLVENKHYIFSPTGRIAVRTERNDTTVDTRYFHTDGLGSITAVTNEAGQIVKRFAFDAWGKRVNPATNGVITSGTSGKFTRGFTDHEQLDDLGLVHMNGRVYDLVLGRFLSADPTVDGANDAQGFNRYSYVGNNPLGATDPTGFFSFKDVVKIAAIVVVSYFTAGLAVYALGATSGATLGSSFLALTSSGGFSLTFAGAVAAGAGAGFGSAFAGSLLNGGSVGDAFRAGAIGGLAGALTGALARGVGDFFGHQPGSFENEFGRAVAHGAAGGAVAEIQGGEFRHGFYSSFAASAAGSLSPRLGMGSPEDLDDSSSKVALRTSFAAVVGGTASALGGGKFANGAVTATFQHLLNAEKVGGYPKRTLRLITQREETTFVEGAEAIARYINGKYGRMGVTAEVVLISNVAEFEQAMSGADAYSAVFHALIDESDRWSNLIRLGDGGIPGPNDDVITITNTKLLRMEADPTKNFKYYTCGKDKIYQPVVRPFQDAGPTWKFMAGQQASDLASQNWNDKNGKK